MRGFITYLNPKLRDDDIPKKSTMAAAVSSKVAHLEQVTMEIIDVRIYAHPASFYSPHQLLARSFKSIDCVGRVVHP